VAFSYYISPFFFDEPPLRPTLVTLEKESTAGTPIGGLSDVNLSSFDLVTDLKGKDTLSTVVLVSVSLGREVRSSINHVISLVGVYIVPQLRVSYTQRKKRRERP
jgi:hypothetical protein